MTNAAVAAETLSAPATLELTRRFAAPRQAVFEALTHADKLAAWFGPAGANAKNVEVDLRSGGKYSMILEHGDSTHTLSGIYKEVSPPDRLVCTWIWGEGEFAGIETLVTIDLRDLGDETELTLVHEKLASEQAAELHSHGWNGCFDSLVQYLKDRTLANTGGVLKLSSPPVRETSWSS